MIYFASFFVPDHHHGAVVSIDPYPPNRKELKGVKIASELDCFFPSGVLMSQWDEYEEPSEGWEFFEQGYWALMRSRDALVKKWLFGLPRYRPLPEMTLCTNPLDDRYCHRRLVAAIVRKYQPEIFGGRDLPTIKAGDRVTWTTCPPAVDKVVGSAFKVISVQGDMAELPHLYHLVPVAELRPIVEVAAS